MKYVTDFQLIELFETMEIEIGNCSDFKMRLMLDASLKYIYDKLWEFQINDTGHMNKLKMISYNIESVCKSFGLHRKPYMEIFEVIRNV